MKPAILLTRPEPAAGQLAEALTARGFEVFRCPVLETAPVDDPERARRELRAALPADWVVFVSPAAVAHALALVPADRFRDARIAAPGPGTARALEEAGLAPVVCPESGFTSEALLALPAFEQMKTRRVVICNAPGGRQVLARTLVRRGARVREVQVYRRGSVPPPPEIAEAIGGTPELITLVTSQSALAALRAGLDSAAWRHLLTQRLLVSSGRLASAAREAGFRRVEVIAGADDGSVLAALARDAC